MPLNAHVARLGAAPIRQGGREALGWDPCPVTLRGRCRLPLHDPYPPFWRRPGPLVFHAYGAPNKMFCGGGESALTGTHRTASHQSGTGSVARSVLPEGPEVAVQVRTTRRAVRIRARGIGGTPLRVIWLFPGGPGSPGLCWDGRLALSKLGGCHARR